MDGETKFAWYAIVFSLIGILAIIRLIYILPACSSPLLSTSKNSSNSEPLPLSEDKDLKESYKLMVLLGSGGHTGEMIRILDQFEELNTKFPQRSYVVSSGDSTSLYKIKQFEEKTEEEESSKNDIDYFVIPRARAIKQSTQLAIYNTLKSTVITFFKLVKVWQNGKLPNVLLLNGPGTSIPLSYLIFMFKYFGLTNCKIIYVESLARVNKLSMTGYLIMPIANRFIVQWENLSRAYKRCEYYGILV